MKKESENDSNQPQHQEEEEPELHAMSSPNYQPSSPQLQPNYDETSQRYVFPPPEQSSHTYAYSPPQLKSQSPPPQPPSPPAVMTVDGDVAAKKVEEGGNNKNNNRTMRPSLSIMRRSKWDKMEGRALLVLRILSFLFCLLSFSVLAADKNQGWALDSFYSYKEFRYCMGVNVISFVYSGFQAYHLVYSLTTKKSVNRDQLRSYLYFSVDQIMAYLLLSASSSASFRIEEWESNWGKDDFPTMARASVAFSYLAFCAFALSSIISGHALSASVS